MARADDFGPAWEFVAAEARAADIVIASIDGDHSVLASGQTEVGDLLMRMGRPMLIAPQGAAGFGLPAGAVSASRTRARPAGRSPTPCRC